MPVTVSLDGSVLTARLSGDIDHFTAADMRSEIDRAITMNPVSELILDFSAVNFMDSSGIGLVMGRSKLMSELGGKCSVCDPPTYIVKVMKLSGIDKLCPITGEGGVRL